MFRWRSRLAIAMAALALAASVAPAQDRPESLSTDDVTQAEDSVTSVAAADAAAAAANEGAVVASTAADGYTRVTASGYSFERPGKWVQVQNLQTADAPTFFKYDAVYQDPRTGAVLSAISVDRAQATTPIDIADESSVTSLLVAMLNPTGAKEGAKLFKTTSGRGPNGARWLRIKAQGQGQAVDGTTVETNYWVQFLQTDALLALVAVGYPSSQQDAVGEAAFHAVRTLEIANGRGPAAGDTGSEPQSDGIAPQAQEDSQSSLREQ